MADDTKQPSDRPPLADKGEARPLTRTDPDDAKAADPWSGKRPSGLHSRPDLYGARAVIRRPIGGSPGAGGATARPPGHEDEVREPGGDAPRVAPGTDARRGADSEAPSAGGPPPPAANLLDHPPRMPQSISFEDRAGDPLSEPEEGARAPAAASSAMDEPDPDRLRPRHRPVGDAPQNRQDAMVDPGRTATPSNEATGRAGQLLAWLGSEASVRRLRGDRRALAVAAVSGAALLLIVLAGGIVGLSGEDEQTVQQAQSRGAPAADDPAGRSDSPRQDLPVEPAGSNFGIDQPSRLGPDRSGAVTADRTGGSQLATLPDSRASAPPDPSREPIVDFMRIDPDGKAVVAGRAAPGAELIVLDNGEPLGTTTADIYGLWTFVSPHPLAGGRHEIGLRVKRQGSEVSDPVLVTDGGAAGLGIPEPAAALDAAGTGDGGRQDRPATDQLAAAGAVPPVQSDQAVPQQAAEPTTADTDGASEGAQPATSVAAPPSQPAPGADQPDESTAQQAGSAGTGEPAPAPAAKPEPAERLQTAAVPAGGDYVIQLASFKNPETAVREQAVVEEQFSDLLAGLEVFVQQVDLAEQGTYYRVRLGPFASLAEARAACARFQERDHDCLALAR